MRFKIFVKTVSDHLNYTELVLPEHCIEVCIVDLLQHPGGRSDFIFSDRDAPGLTCRVRDMALAVIPRATNTIDLVPTPYTREPAQVTRPEVNTAEIALGVKI